MEWPPGLRGLTFDYISQLCFALLIFASLGSRCLEVKGERENGRAQGRHARVEEAPARKAPENHFNSHSVSADISNWLRGSPGKKLPRRGKLSINNLHGQCSEDFKLHH